jgi:hypothetical protein
MTVLHQIVSTCAPRACLRRRRLLLIACGDALALDSLKILVPAAPGGGWDQTGRALQAALQSEAPSRRSPSTTKAGPAARSASRSS